MKERRHRIFIGLMLLICMFPLVGILIFGTAQPAANETLAAFPSLTESDGSFNLNVLSDFSDWLSDRFALRQEMTTLWRKLVANLFGESDEAEVILGRDGWLFYAETLDDYEGTDLMTEREVFSAARTLYLMQEACEAEDITFLFTVAPNKNSLYGEYMPARYPASDTDSNLAMLTEALAEQDVAYLDLYALLEAEDEILYRRYDSHWTNAGAALAADAILAALDVDAEPFYGTASTTVAGETGDLYEMLYPAGTQTDEDVLYDRAFTFSYTSAIRSAEDNRIVTTSETAAGGSLLMFRDSFGNALYPFLAENFQSATFSRITPWDLTTAESLGADTVVIELVERNLDWLLTRPAVFAAPVRTLDAQTTLTDAVTFTAVVTEDGPDDCVQLSGSFTAEGLDEDSPVYIRVGSTLYEATPAGDAEENPFTAYISSAALEAADGSVSVVVRVNGVWMESKTEDN